MMSSTGDPPEKRARVSSNINNDNNSNNSSSFACNSEQSSSNNNPVLSKQEHVNVFDLNSINTPINTDKYFDKRLTKLSMEQKKIVESRTALYKQLAELSAISQACKERQSIYANFIKDMKLYVNKVKEMIHEKQAELLRTNQQIKQKDDEFSSIQKQLDQIMNEMSNKHKFAKMSQH